MPRPDPTPPEIPAVLRGDGPPDAPKLKPIPTSTPVSGLSLAYGIAVEFVVYILLCAGIGYAVDRWLIGPDEGGAGQIGVTWTVVGGAFGLVGGVVRLMKASQRMNR